MTGEHTNLKNREDVVGGAAWMNSKKNWLGMWEESQVIAVSWKPCAGNVSK